MNKEREIFEITFRNWIDANRHELPISAFFWTLHAVEPISETPKSVKLPGIALGKYKAAVHRTNSFYKPYSKTFII